MVAHSSTTSATAGLAPGTTISTFTVTGTDAALVLIVSTKSASVTVTGATWNGSENFTIEGSDISSDARCTMLTLTAPTATTADVIVSLSGSVRHTSILSLYTGVNQTNTLRSATFNSNNGTDAAPTVNVTGSSGDLIVDGISQVSAGPDTATAARTERANVAAIGGGTDTRGASQDFAATGGSDTMSWTMAGSQDWAIVAGSIQDAGGGGGGLSIPIAAYHYNHSLKP